MIFYFGFYSSLLLITFSQGIIYSVLLLKKAIQTETKSNYWLSAFVFVCSLFVMPWMVGFAGWYDTQPYRDILFYTPFQHLFLIGPIIYFYTQSLLNPSFKLSFKNALHFLPGILYIFYIFSLWVYDKLILGKPYFYEDGMDKDFDTWYQYAGFISMTIYFILSIRFYNFYRKVLVQVRSDAYDLLFDWIKKYLYAFLGMILLRFIFDVASNFFEILNSYKGSWWFFLMYSIILYYISIIGYSNGVSSKIAFENRLFQNQTKLLLNHHGSNNEEIVIDIDYENESFSNNAEIEHWKMEIELLIVSNSLYQNPELTLNDVAKKLETNASIISKAINQGFQLNFNDYINNYRIEAVKKAFDKGEHKNATLLGIAFDSGFNSKATFNRAFKKNTGKTPKEYLLDIKL
jgi:AraC-like DNA-binding protein